MFSDAGVISTGYRQPAQARVFGRAIIVVAALIAGLLLSIRLTAPPAAAIDSGRMATFVVKPIPLDRPDDPPRPVTADPPAPSVAPAPPSPATRGDATVPSPRPLRAAVPTTVTVPGNISGAVPAATTVSSEGQAVPPVPVPAYPAASPAAATSTAADWRARLLSYLQRYRRYPRQAEAARQQGVARIAIALRRSGDVVAAELVRGSGYPLLDMEARATVRRASPLPAPDAAIPGDPVIVEVPIDFALRR